MHSVGLTNLSEEEIERFCNIKDQGTFQYLQKSNKKDLTENRFNNLPQIALSTLNLKEVMDWAGFNYCIESLEKVMIARNSTEIGQEEINQLRRSLLIDSDNSFYKCIDNGINVALKIVAYNKQRRGYQDILKTIPEVQNHGLKKFIIERIIHYLEMNEGSTHIPQDNVIQLSEFSRNAPRSVGNDDQESSIDERLLLKNIPLLEDLPDDGYDIIVKNSIVSNYPKNTKIVNEGEESSSLYLIVSGKVKEYLSDEAGKEIIVGIRGAGEYFGELALLGEFLQKTSFMTIEPSKIAIITKAQFEELLNRSEIASRLIKKLTKKQSNLTPNVKSLALMDVYGRVARTLMNMAEPSGDKLEIRQLLTTRDLAGMVGASREMVNRILKDLEIGGYITIEGKKITINEKLPPGW